MCRLFRGTIPYILALTVAGLVFIMGGIAVAHAQPGDPSPAGIGPGNWTYFFPVQPPAVAHYPLGHHDYPAADIFAPRDSLFVAATSGRIQELSREDAWNPKADDPALRGGRFVSLIGDDGVRYYGSHLNVVVAGLTPGQHVDAGQILGYVGTSGNARGGQTHLHFGLSHPTFAGDWAVRRGELAPYVYLQARQRGGNLTPALPERTAGQK